MLSASSDLVAATSGAPWLQMALPGGGFVSVPLASPETTSLLDAKPGTIASSSLETASVRSAGDAVTTHLNFDQLLELVQSFQLDTSLAEHEHTQQLQQQLALGVDGCLTMAAQVRIFWKACSLAQDST